MNWKDIWVGDEAQNHSTCVTGNDPDLTREKAHPLAGLMEELYCCVKQEQKQQQPQHCMLFLTCLGC